MPDGLLAAGCIVERHCDHFDSGIDDPSLLSALAPRAHELIFLTKDGRIRRRPLELKALKASGLRVFCLTSGNLSSAAQAEAFSGAVKRIRRIALAHQGPFIARVTAASDVELITVDWD
ncbi:MAG: hypothetical protein IT177_05865 [Acidobacteria bacterium]|nr:hypothetical protein [Acidobacteriota bacterium]